MKLLLGIGHEFRRDDGVGAYVAQALNKNCSYEVMIISGDLSNIMDTIRQSEELILIDAFQADQDNCCLKQWSYPDEAPAVDWNQHSTHGFGPMEGLEMARALGVLPSKVMIYGIPGYDFSDGKGLSEKTKKIANDLIGKLKG